MVEVFKTNVRKLNTAKELMEKLLLHFPDTKINFDLGDCDKILRVEGDHVPSAKIIEFLHSYGYQLELLY
jgi:hypothetical protein